MQADLVTGVQRDFLTQSRKVAKAQRGENAVGSFGAILFPSLRLCAFAPLRDSFYSRVIASGPPHYRLA
jgi:hypothetical protein